MIDMDFLFNQIKDNLAVKCSHGLDTTDLISKIENMVSKNISVVSAHPESVVMIWSWIEKSNINIFARFSVQDDSDISELVQDINHVFKKGASGAQIFMSAKLINNFTDQMLPVYSDLFFNKSMVVGLDLSEIGPFEFSRVFSKLNEIGSHGLLLTFDENSEKDFVGTIYGFINALPDNFNMDLQFMFGNDAEKIEQTWRLFEKLRPNLLSRIRFFIEN